jgi:hypothetical protein
MRNPFAPHHTREQVDSAFQQVGWGNKIERRVTRAAGEPLYFQLRLPDDIALIPVQELVPAVRETPTWLQDQIVVLDQVQTFQGLILVGGIADHNTPEDVISTASVVYSEHVKDPGKELQEGTTRVDRPGEKAIVHVTHLKHGYATLVQRTSMLGTPKEGEEGIPMISTTFLRKTKFGGLAVSFSSTHAGGGSEQVHDFYCSVYDTVYLGDSEPPTDGYIHT